VKDTVIPAKAQSFVELSMVNKVNCIKSQTLVFEPFNFTEVIPEGCIIAKSFHSNLESDKVYCNVINASDKQVVFKSETVIGQAFEVDEALNKFNEEIKKYEHPPKNYFEERAAKRVVKLEEDFKKKGKLLNWNRPM
jgi:hypothetical protein